MIINLVKGMLIGIANIIPGVSGGTFALILGIYDRLIMALGGFDLEMLKKITAPRDFASEFTKKDGFFLIQILSGALIAIGVFSWLIDHLLKNHPSMTLSFFMGLIIPSIAIPYKMIEKKSILNGFFIIPAVVLVIIIYNIKAPFSEVSLGIAFFSGLIAICAMILPGISGSFLLLVIGVYETVLSNIKAFTASFEIESFIFLAVFGSGCIAGLFLFVRLMKILLKKYKDRTLYFLIGLVIGSVIVLWPFKDYNSIGPEKIEIAITTSKNIMPEDIREVYYCLFFIVMGFLSSFGFNFIEKKGNK